jgi:hypothetical protein
MRKLVVIVVIVVIAFTAATIAACESVAGLSGGGNTNTTDDAGNGGVPTSDSGASDPPDANASFDAQDLDGGGLWDGGPLPVTNCSTSTGFMYAGKFPDGRRATASTGYLYFVNASLTAVLALPKAGGLSTAILTLPTASISAIFAEPGAGFSSGLAVAYHEGATRHVLRPTGGAPVNVPTGAPLVDVTVARPGGTDSRMYVSTGADLFKIQDSAAIIRPGFGGPIAAGTRAYARDAAGFVKALTRSLDAVNDLTVAIQNPSTLILGADDNIYGAVSVLGGAGVIVNLSGVVVTNVVTGLPKIPTTIAVDDLYMYYAIDNTIYRASKVGGGASILLHQEPAGSVVDHLFADLAAPGCLYFWAKAMPSSTEGRLVVRKKSP